MWFDINLFSYWQVILLLVKDVAWTQSPACVSSSSLATCPAEGFHVSTTVTEPESTRQPRISSLPCYERERERERERNRDTLREEREEENKSWHQIT